MAVRGGNAPVDEAVRKSKQKKLCTDGSLCKAFKEHVKGAQEMEEKLRQLPARDPSVLDAEPATTAARTGGDAYTRWRGVLTKRPLDEILAAIELARNRQALPVLPMPRVRKPDLAMPAFVVLRNALASSCVNYNAKTAGYSRVCFDIKAKNVGAEAAARRRRGFDITILCSCGEFQKMPIGFGGGSKRGGTKLCMCAKLVILAASCKAARMNVSKGEQTYDWVDVVLGAGLPPVPPKTTDSMEQPSLEEGIPLDEGATDDDMAPSPESESDDWFPALATEADDGAAAAAPAQKSTKAEWKKDELKMELEEIMGSAGAGTPRPLRFPPEFAATEWRRFYGVEATANQKLSEGHLPSSGEVFPLDELNFSGDAEPTCPSCAGGCATDLFKLSRYKHLDKSEAAIFVGNVIVKRAACVYFCTNKGHDPEKRSLFYPRGVDFSMRTGLFGVGPKHFFSIALLEEVTANVIQMRTEPSTACAAALKRTWEYMKVYLNDGEQGDVGAASLHRDTDYLPKDQVHCTALMYKAWKAYEMVFKPLDEKYSTCVHCGFFPPILGLDANAKMGMNLKGPLAKQLKEDPLARETCGLCSQAVGLTGGFFCTLACKERHKYCVECLVQHAQSESAAAGDAAGLCLAGDMRCPLCREMSKGPHEKVATPNHCVPQEATMLLCQQSLAKEACLGRDNDEKAQATDPMDKWRMAPCFFDPEHIASGRPYNTCALKKPLCQPCDDETPTTSALQPLAELIESGKLDPARLRWEELSDQPSNECLQAWVGECMEMDKPAAMSGAACRQWLVKALDTLESGESNCHLFTR